MDLPMELAAQDQEEWSNLDLLADLDVLEEKSLCIALFGEFSAGKSSLVNLIAGNDILPTHVLSCTRRLSRLCYADSVQITAVNDKQERLPVSIDEVTSPVDGAFREIEIGFPCDRLRRLEILDTPGFGDPYHDSRRTLDVAEQADLAIWCTRASQAWRHSEWSVWRNLPKRLHKTGILVVTRCDRLPSDADRRRLLKRLQRDAGPFFGAIVLMSIPDAARAHDQATGRFEGQLWRRSGGEALTLALLKALRAAADEDHEWQAPAATAEPEKKPEESDASQPSAETDGDVIPAPAPDRDDLEFPPMRARERMQGDIALPASAPRPTSSPRASHQPEDVAPAGQTPSASSTQADDGKRGSDSNVPAPGPSDDAGPKTETATAAPDASVRLDSDGPKSEADHLLAIMLEAMPTSCLGLAYVDLDKALPMALHARTEMPAAIGNRLASLAADLLVGSTGAKMRRQAADTKRKKEANVDDVLQEITIGSGNLHYVFVRRNDLPAHAVAVISDNHRPINQALVTARMVLAKSLAAIQDGPV